MPKAKKPRMRYKFEFLHNKKTQHPQKFRWRAVSTNGRIVCHSEVFLHKLGPKATVRNLIRVIQLGQIKVIDKYMEERL